MATVLLDRHDRPLRNLRLSVTDRCNLRCHYCMPEQEYVWLPREDILQFEEIERLIGIFEQLGVDRIRLTGGEPLLRRDLPDLIARLARRQPIRDLAMTTNGVLLATHASALKEAGLHRITVSLDTLDRQRFLDLTRSDELARVIAGIEAAAGVFGALKIDSVVIRGVNDDEVGALVDFGRQHRAEVRFIEYMDVGGATRWSFAHVVPRTEILERLAETHGPAQPLLETSSAPATRYRLEDGTIFGIIASTTAPFCQDCDRSRLTADGAWYQCLYATAGLDLRALLRSGAVDAQVMALISSAWTSRMDRGAEQRLAARDRAPLIPVDRLRRDPHLEMHTRGG
jgi:cyclic pyranopterin phosphate synthase